MNRVKIIVIVFAIIILVLLGVLAFVPSAKGPTVSEALPLTSSDGHLVVTEPLSGALVNSPVSVAGSVTGGGWFFEAVFPVKVLDGDGTVLGQSPAQAQGDWMTTGTVPFTDTITFSAPKYATGTILLEKDNPSGLPQNTGELRVPVRFK